LCNDVVIISIVTNKISYIIDQTYKHVCLKYATKVDQSDREKTLKLFTYLSNNKYLFEFQKFKTFVIISSFLFNCMQSFVIYRIVPSQIHLLIFVAKYMEM